MATPEVALEPTGASPTRAHSVADARIFVASQWQLMWWRFRKHKLALISGDPILAESAVKAVKQWKYKPYILNGKPVLVESQVTVRYHM